MSVRETLRDRPYISIGVLAGIILITIAAAWSGVSSGVRQPSLPSQMYFSDDDGKTFFSDDSANIPPFDHQGKEAVQAAVFRCGGKEFVGYLIRFDDASKAALETMPKSDRAGTNAKALQIRQTGAMVKRPGEKDWIRLTGDRPTGQILSPACPDGSDETPKQVMP